MVFERPGLTSERPELFSEGSGLAFERLGQASGRPGLASEEPGGTDVRTDGRTDSPCILHDFVPSGTLRGGCPKRD